MKFILQILLAVCIIASILVWSSWRDKRVNDYWAEQFALCHKVGYYHVGGGYCVPAEGAYEYEN